MLLYSISIVVACTQSLHQTLLQTQPKILSFLNHTKAPA
uniref:Uncharacterized protein n=1 Tax=Rhizophora mucronata TaxID=61149 RepID=A0A2P2QD03_RHIMU